MAIEGGGFVPGLWYNYCKDCSTWYPDKHFCLNPPPPPTPLWQQLYLSWRRAPLGSKKRKIMLQAWIDALGGKVIEDDSEAPTGVEPCP